MNGGTADDGLVVPDYGGANVRGIIPGLLGPRPWSELPEWFPAPVRDADQVVVLILDGLGWEQLLANEQHLPTLSSFTGGPITTVAPTTTATALTSIATGLTPGEHGLIGYRMLIKGEVMNVLRWIGDSGNRRRAVPPTETQPFVPFLGENVPVVSPAELQDSAFTEAHLRGCQQVGYRATSAIAVETRRQLAAGERMVYAYYGFVDKTAHERGFGDFYEAELRAADRIVSDIAEILPAGAALLVTADHGQVEVGDNIIHPDPKLMAGVTTQSGEGRFRWWHTAGDPDELAKAAHEVYGDIAWVRTREQLIDEQWFGPTVPPPVASRLGDVALVARADVSFFDPADSGPFELVCRHGSMTSAEMLVPLLGFAPGGAA